MGDDSGIAAPQSSEDACANPSAGFSPLSHDNSLRTLEDPLSQSGTLVAMGELLAQLKDSVQELKTGFDDKIKFDAGREAVIDSLHAEIQEYKADLALTILKPVALDLINLHDDIGKIIFAHRAEEADTAITLLKLIASFQSDVEDILYRNGFEAFTTGEAQFEGTRLALVTSSSASDTDLANGSSYGSFQAKPLRSSVPAVRGKATTSGYYCTN